MKIIMQSMPRIVESLVLLNYLLDISPLSSSNRRKFSPDNCCSACGRILTHLFRTVLMFKKMFRRISYSHFFHLLQQEMMK